MNQKIQLIEKEIEQQGQTVRIIEDLDKDYEKLTGIALLDNFGLNSELVSSSLGGSELFPKNFEALFLQSNVFVPPDMRFFTIQDREAKGNKLEIDFKDGGTAGAYPYTLRIYLRLDNEQR